MAFTPFVESDLPTMANFNAKFLECIAEAVGKSAKIEVGSFVGTNVLNETITIPTEGVPKLCVMAKANTDFYSSGVDSLYLWVPGITRQRIYYVSSTGVTNYLWFSWSEEGLSFYESRTSGSTVVFNTGTIYYAIIT